MKIATSFYGNRIERQQACLESWKRHGLEIVAVQSAGETEELSPYFPGVTFTETDKVAHEFGRPRCVKISALAELASDDPVLIINSDIEIRATPDEFKDRWHDVPENTLQVGIRYDHDERKRRGGRMNRWGIDVFRITQKIASDLCDIGMAIGCPGWDYWIPFHLHHCGYRIDARKEPFFFHAKHPQRWSRAHYDIGVGILTEKYQVSPPNMARFIRKITHR